MCGEGFESKISSTGRSPAFGEATRINTVRRREPRYSHQRRPYVPRQSYLQEARSGANGQARRLHPAGPWVPAEIVLFPFKTEKKDKAPTYISRVFTEPELNKPKKGCPEHTVMGRSLFGLQLGSGAVPGLQLPKRQQSRQLGCAVHRPGCGSANSACCWAVGWLGLAVWAVG